MSDRTADRTPEEELYPELVENIAAGLAAGAFLADAWSRRTSSPLGALVVELVRDVLAALAGHVEDNIAELAAHVEELGR